MSANRVEGVGGATSTPHFSAALLFLLPVARLLEARSGLQSILGGVHRQINFIILHCLLYRLERYGDVLFAGAEEAADSDNQRVDLAAIRHEHVVDFPIFVVEGS
jgi:hypothetical protein